MKVIIDVERYDRFPKIWFQAVWGGMSSIGRKAGTSGKVTSGTASSVAFTPVQVG